ncbi:hypothetical protein P280DRAFT_510543 [Massarina eburnea CBS 473.64]|uniref:Zn(2)-C6 fungal-type domain-containing protein n=1 Tax=Massarina eburnea CBS 473.64 TaxID=1395130 RepID=A0A6A6RP87_9PLEO|nr:hypothetical protein P280DRAFT_510543 [Massarina eburnea CBS 473.64]
MPRLGHTKSRNGCRQCKSRHVKCDEKKPCSNCVRHGVLCTLVDPNVAVPVPPVSSAGTAPQKRPSKTKLTERPKKEPQEGGSSPSQALPLDSILNPSAEESNSPSSGADTFPFLTKFVYRRENVQTNLWLKDLELMHHWMAECADMLSQREDVRHIWKIVAPREAINHTFLMHEILAMSAFHLGSLYPEKHSEYFALGIHHQDHALRSIRKAIANITDANASPLFGASTLITLSVFASRGQDALRMSQDPVAHHTDTKNVITDLADIFALIQGMGVVVAAAQMTVMNGPFGGMFKDPAHETLAQPMFAQLLDRIPSLITFFESGCDLPSPLRRELLAFVALMRDNLLRAMRPCIDNRELRFLFYWPLHLSPNFLALLRQKNEASLVVLMYWAIVLYAAEPRYWFLAGWSDRTIKAISEAVTDPMWRGAIEWPLRFAERHRSTPPRDDRPVEANRKLQRPEILATST